MSMEQARSSAANLLAQVQQVLKSNEDLQARMAGLSAQSIVRNPNGDTLSVAAEMNDDTPTMTSARAKTGEIDVGIEVQTTRAEFGFDEDLHVSRVYRRAMLKPSRESVTSSTFGSIGWSFLSGLSLGNISNMAVIALPLFPEELWNPEHYSHAPEDPFKSNGFVSETGAGQSCIRPSSEILILSR